MGDDYSGRISVAEGGGGKVGEDDGERDCEVDEDGVGDESVAAACSCSSQCQTGHGLTGDQKKFTFSRPLQGQRS